MICQPNGLHSSVLLHVAAILEGLSKKSRSLFTRTVFLKYWKKEKDSILLCGKQFSQPNRALWSANNNLSLRFLSLDWNPSSWSFSLNYITPCHKLVSKFTCSGLYKEMLTLAVIVRKKLSFILVPDEPFPHLVPYVIPTLLEFLDGLKTQVNNFNFT